MSNRFWIISWTYKTSEIKIKPGWLLIVVVYIPFIAICVPFPILTLEMTNLLSSLKNSKSWVMWFVQSFVKLLVVQSLSINLFWSYWLYKSKLFVVKHDIANLVNPKTRQGTWVLWGATSFWGSVSQVLEYLSI